MSLWAVWIGVALSLWSCSSSGSGSTKDVVAGVTEVSPVDGTCDDACDLQCEQGLPGQACTYCQAACLSCLQPLPGHVQSEGLIATSRWRRTGETVVRGRVVLALIFALQASTPSSAAPPPASSKDVYGGLVAPGATWRLTADGGADGPALIGEVLGVDTIAGVRVARLRWTVSTAEGSRTLDFPEPLPTAVAVSTRGLWILDDLFEDSSPSDGPLSAEVVKRIEKQLKRSPSFRSPPKMIAPETRKDGVYVERVDTAVGSGVCIGVGPGRDDEPCDDVCYSQYCLVAGHGVVSVSGRLASTVAGSDELWQPASRPPKSAP